MPEAGIKYVDLTGAEGNTLSNIVYVEVSSLLDGNVVNAEAIGRHPWERNQFGDRAGEMMAEEYRARFMVLTDLVALQDLVGWEEGNEVGVRVRFYPSVVRALGYCRAMFERASNEKEEYRDDWEFLDRLLKAASDG